MDFMSVAQYGLAGVCVALVYVLYRFMNGLFLITGNHLDHNTQAINKLSEVIQELKDFLKK